MIAKTMPSESPTPRLFFAVPVGEEARAGARAAIDSLRRCGADVRWAEPETMHLTLRFLGQTPKKALPGLERALAGATAGRTAFEVVFDRLGSFNDRGLPKVVWAGVGPGAPELSSLAGALNAALKEEGFPDEDRPFRAHLTLGRLRSPRGGAFLRRALAEAAPLSWRCPVERVILYKSELGGGGAKHTDLAERILA